MTKEVHDGDRRITNEMTEEEKQKYIAKAVTTNCVIGFIAINKENRMLVDMYLKMDGTLTDNVIDGALFSDPMSAFTFLKSAPFEVPVLPDGYEMLPFSLSYRLCKVTRLFLPKNESGEYTCDAHVAFGVGRVNTTGCTVDHEIINNTQPLSSGDQNHV